MRPLSWSTSYLFRCPLGISTSTSNSSTSASASVVGPHGPGCRCGPLGGGPGKSPAQWPQTRSRKGQTVGRRDARHGSGRPLRWLPVFLVLALLLTATATYRFDLGDRWFGPGRPDPSTDPAAVPPPEGLSLPPLTPPDAVARALET